MKILQIITGLGGGGAEKITALLAEGLKAGGHEVIVLSLLPQPETPGIPQRLERAGIEVRYLNAAKSDPCLLWKLRRAIREIAPDLVHSHLMHPNLLSRLACAGLGIPVVNTIHTAEKRRRKGIYFLLDRLTRRLAWSVTAVSRAAAAFHEKACGFPPGSIHVIRNAVEPVIPAPAELCTELLKLWAPEGADKIIGSIGRLDAMKGYELLLDRLDPLSRIIPPNAKWLILILGDGPDREKLERKAAALRLENLRVVFAGFRADAAPLMNLFDVFLSTSLCEGYGLAAAEAMTLGLPLVCNGTDAIPELCRAYNGDSFLFDMTEDTEGEDMALKLLSASECARSAGQCISSPEKMIRSYLVLYQVLLKKRKKPFDKTGKRR